MTRSIKIINTSNWEHEDVVVVIDGVMQMLKPGEHAYSGPYSKGIPVQVNMIGVEGGEPVPFRDAEGVQQTPSVKVIKPIQGAASEERNI